ncbi:MAG: hypothetical protein GY780_17735 [bacterium]|nr:hypothetical protein [bacterium]
MIVKNTHLIRTGACFCLVFILFSFSGPSAGAAGLTNSESDGYLQWMHSLEKVMESRKEAGIEEGNLLYPFDRPGWQGEETRPFRHLSISKAVLELEQEWLLRGSEKVNSPLIALANARNYVNLSEYDSALVWYEKAAELDKENNFMREISKERMASAAANRDSMGMLAAITNTIGTTKITGKENEYILALRWLLVQRDSETLDLVLQKIKQDQNNLTDRLRFWVAYSHSWRKRGDESMSHLRILLGSGGLSRDLTESQRSWVLFAIPDYFFLSGDHASSRSLYEVLTRSAIPELSTWGRYQIANLDFLNGLYLRASEGFKRVCEGDRIGSWQDQACEMAIVATEIERIKSEGEPYGAGSFYTP